MGYPFLSYKVLKPQSFTFLSLLWALPLLQYYKVEFHWQSRHLNHIIIRRFDSRKQNSSDTIYWHTVGSAHIW